MKDYLAAFVAQKTIAKVPTELTEGGCVGSVSTLDGRFSHPSPRDGLPKGGRHESTDTEGEGSFTASRRSCFGLCPACHASSWLVESGAPLTCKGCGYRVPSLFSDKPTGRALPPVEPTDPPLAGTCVIRYWTGGGCTNPVRPGKKTCAAHAELRPCCGSHPVFCKCKEADRG